MIRLLVGILLFGLVIYAAHRFEHGDWTDPRTGTRHCRTPPEAVRAWSYTHRERQPADRANLERWIREQPADLDRLYGASCVTALHSAARFGREDLAQ
ncbi:MAG: hypothetical protein ACRDJC_24655, partial [Thermomicrobiales bacterium]